MRRFFVAAILVLGLPQLGLVMATPASAQTAPTIEVTSATLVARGAAVDVGTSVTCEAAPNPPFANASVFVRVTQAVGKRVAQGVGLTEFACTGQPQTLTVRVTAEVVGTPFKKGTALAAANLQACGLFQCESAPTSQVVRITR